MGVKGLSEVLKRAEELARIERGEKVVLIAEIKMADLKGKKLAFDGFNVLYQFLSVVRQSYGAVLTDTDGNVTSHLDGLLRRYGNFMGEGIKPVFIFDGKPVEMKREELRRRAEIKKKASEEYKKAMKEGDMKRAVKMAKRTTKLTKDIIDDSKRLLKLMGVPVIDAPSDGEAQAAVMVQKDKVWSAASQDYDTLLFGAKRVVRNLSLTRTTRKDGTKIKPEIIKIDEVLKELEMTRAELIDASILIGTDFNPDGIAGIGPKTAIKIIKKHKNLEEAMKHDERIRFDVEIDDIREIFLKPDYTENYNLKQGEFDIDGIIEFLVEERKFQRERLENALFKIRKKIDTAHAQTTLDAFF
ncbi:MAG: flap endonuclease-1 [Candidatus Kariarchaeaceae archaeon]